MITIAIALIVIGSVAIVAYPLFKRSDELDVAFVGRSDPTWEGLVAQRDATYSAIKDLEFDHVMGKLSDADYKTLRVKYETKAVAISQELDSMSESRNASSDAIEREVGEFRRASANGSMKCLRCGTPHMAGDVFCVKCGTMLKGIRCPSCGRRAALGDQFCSKCGSPIVG